LEVGGRPVTGDVEQKKKILKRRIIAKELDGSRNNKKRLKKGENRIIQKKYEQQTFGNSREGTK